MSKNFRYTLIGLGLAFIVFLLWFFSNIVVYIIIAAVVALVGNPIVEFLGRLHIKKFRIPLSIRALIALICLYGVFIGFFWIFVPIVAKEANSLSDINADTLLSQVQEPLDKLSALYDKYQVHADGGPDLETIIREKVKEVLDVSILSNFVTSMAEMLGNIFIALFSITFISFFFLQEQGMIVEAIAIMVPGKYEKPVRHALASVKHLLIRYFVGIGGQLTGILLLVTIGMTIVGLDFKQSLLIGLTAAVVNIIPYLGPLIGTGLGILMGLAFHIDAGIVNLIPMVGYMIIVYMVVHAIDNFIFQPFIFSNSVSAHPLEIFLVIMMAGSIGGVTGMILAIPAYTIIRVFAKEFFNNFRLVKKLTEKI
ncbi:MAG: AI-2E family transporter [Bacteroidales bacterium]|nr:AI-2E family transporter [Bacteroidales bacterium]MCB8999677.1 AI-2E family transporter [Bacteroidales bacterium]